MANPQQSVLFSTFLLLIFFLFAAETQAKGKCKYMYGQCLTAFDYISPHQLEQECMRIAKGSINMPAASVKECGFLDLGIMPKCWVCPGVKPLTPAGAKCGHRWAPCKTEYEYMIKYLAIKECEKLSPYFTTFDEQMQSCGFMNLGKRARCTICPGTPKNATVMDPVFLGTE